MRAKRWAAAAAALLLMLPFAVKAEGGVTLRTVSCFAGLVGGGVCRDPSAV